MIACMQQLSLACNIQSLFQPLNKKADLDLKLFCFLLQVQIWMLQFSFSSSLLFLGHISSYFSPCFWVRIKGRDSYTSKGHGETNFSAVTPLPWGFEGYIFSFILFVFFFYKVHINARHSISSIIATQGRRKRLGTALRVNSHPRFFRNKKREKTNK